MNDPLIPISAWLRRWLIWGPAPLLALTCLAAFDSAKAAALTTQAQATPARGPAAKPAGKPYSGSVKPIRLATPASEPPAPPYPVQASLKGDYIVVVVNRELITAGELARRIENVVRQAQAAGAPLPPPDQIQQQVLDAMIDEKILLSHSREWGPRIDDAELDRIVAAQAQQNQTTVAELKEQLRSEGSHLDAWRKNLRDQLQIERTRERELQNKVKITETEIDDFLDQRLEAAGAGTQYNVAQILIKVPEGASELQIIEKRRLAEQALSRLKAGESMMKLAAEISDDESKSRGGEFGLRTANRLPDVFVNAVRGLASGQIVPDILRTGAGFHVLQLVERRSPTAIPMLQTRASHILLRPSKSLRREEAMQNLSNWRKQILSGQKTFEALAREFSQDGSASQGGDLGWTISGSFVPEFESVMNQLAIGSISEPIVSRFGIHLIKVADRKETPVEIKKLRDMARLALREQKSEATLSDWLQELRSRAFIEYREVPQ